MGGPPNDPNDPSQYEKSHSAREHVKAELEKQRLDLQERMNELEGLIGLATQGEQAASMGAPKSYGDVQIGAREVKMIRHAQPSGAFLGTSRALGGAIGNSASGRRLRNRNSISLVAGPPDPGTSGLIPMSPSRLPGGFGGGLGGMGRMGTPVLNPGYTPDFSGVGVWAPPEGSIGKYLESQRLILALMAKVGVLDVRDKGPATAFDLQAPSDVDRQTLMKLKELLGPSGNPPSGGGQGAIGAAPGGWQGAQTMYGQGDTRN